MQPSPPGQRHGSAMKVQRLPVTSSRSPPTFSMPGMPPLHMRILCAGSQSGKSSWGSRPVSALYSSMRCGCDGPRPWSTSLVAMGWSLAWWPYPTSLTFFSTSHSAPSAPMPQP